MDKNIKETLKSSAPSLQEMIEQTKKNSAHNSFIYFQPTKAIFRISYALMWNVWIRLAEGPWRTTRAKNTIQNLENDETIKKNINVFLNNYIYNWKDEEFSVDFDKQKVPKMKQSIVELFVYNHQFSDYIDSVMVQSTFGEIWGFQLIIEPSLFYMISKYSLTPLTKLIKNSNIN